MGADITKPVITFLRRLFSAQYRKQICGSYSQVIGFYGISFASNVNFFFAFYFSVFTPPVFYHGPLPPSTSSLLHCTSAWLRAQCDMGNSRPLSALKAVVDATTRRPVTCYHEMLPRDAITDATTRRPVCDVQCYTPTIRGAPQIADYLRVRENKLERKRDNVRHHTAGKRTRNCLQTQVACHFTPRAAESEGQRDRRRGAETTPDSRSGKAGTTGKRGWRH